MKAYKAFIGHCKFVEPVLFKHLQFLKNSLVELCSQDLHKSLRKAMVSAQQLAKILRLGLLTKKKVFNEYALSLWLALFGLEILYICHCMCS